MPLWHSHSARVSHTCAQDACPALVYRSVVLLLSSPLSLSLSLSLTFRLFIRLFFSFSVSPSDNAAKTADLGLLTMSRPLDSLRWQEGATVFIHRYLLACLLAYLPHSLTHSLTHLLLTCQVSVDFNDMLPPRVNNLWIEISDCESNSIH